MKGLKKGNISLNVTGMVSVVAGEYPDIRINEKPIAAYITDTLGLDKEARENAHFAGTVSLTIENFGEPKIQNTMTTDSTQDGVNQGGAVDAV